MLLGPYRKFAHPTKRRGEPVQPCHFSPELIDGSVGRLATQVGRPFSDHRAMRHLLILGGQLAPYLDRYDTVVAEGMRGTISAAAIWHAVNAARQAKGKAAAAFRYVNGRMSGEPLPDERYFRPQDRSERLLIVAEFTGYGDHIANAISTIGQGRNSRDIDAATVGAKGSWINVPMSLLEGTFFWHPDSEEVEGPLYYQAMQVTPEEAIQDRNAQILGAAIFELAQVSRATRGPTVR